MENMDVEDSSAKKKSGRPVESECMKPSNLQEYSHILRALQEQNTQLLPLGTTNSTLARIVYNLQCFLEVLYIKSSQNSIFMCNPLYRKYVHKDNFGKHRQLHRGVRWPHRIFKDLNLNGAIHVILSSILRLSVELKWKDFEFTDPSKTEALLSLLIEAEKTLVERGFIRWPRIYFQDVPSSVVQELTVIATSHKASIVTLTSEATHVVLWEEEVDSKPPEHFDKEEYIRTLEIRPYEGSGVALVHWWYHPDSYDEWIPMPDAEHTDPENLDSADNCAKQWRVNCKFIRDVQVYHEWGNEIDYCIEIDGDDTIIGTPRVSRSAAKRKASLKKDTGVPGALMGTEKINQDFLPPTDDPSYRSVQIVEVTPNATGNQYETKDLVVARRTPGPRDTLAEEHLAKRKKLATKNAKGSLPDWFSPNVIHAIEAQFLPEFFSGHPSRTPAVYMRIRNLIHGMYQQNTANYISATDVRKQIAGDVCIVLRIHEFLDAFSVINYSISSDKRPSYAPFVPLTSASFSFLRDPNMRSKASNQVVGFGDISPAKPTWTSDADQSLLKAVAATNGNWEKVSSSMKNLVSSDLMTPAACMTRFAELPLTFSRTPATNDPANGVGLLSESLPSKLSSLAAVVMREAATHIGVDRATKLSEIVAKHCEESSKTENPVVEGSADNEFIHCLGLATSGQAIAAFARSRSSELEKDLSQTLAGYLSVRLEVLEEKVKLLDAVESLLESEKIALSLERRDLQIQRAQVSSQQYR